VTLPGGATASVPVSHGIAEPGGVATVMVRPERLRLVAAEPSGDAPGVKLGVVDLTFQGPMVRAGLRAADGTEIVGHIGPEDDLPMLRPNDSVWATWDPDAARLLLGQDPLRGKMSEADEFQTTGG